jgi:hypothetical protein
MESSEEFLRWLDAIGGVSKGGIEKLEKAAISSVRAVHCLTLDDISEIKLAIGDWAIFRAGWSELINPAPRVKSPEEVKSTEEFVQGDDTDVDLKQYSIADITKFFGQPGAQGLSPTQQIGAALQQASSATRVNPRHKEPVTTKTLAKEKLLNRLAAEYAQEGIKDTLSLQELALGLTKGEKVL